MEKYHLPKNKIYSFQDKETLRFLSVQGQNPDFRSMYADAEVDNHSTESVRRVQRVITASYEDPVDKVKAVLLAEFSAHPAVLADPAPYVRVSDFGDSAIEYTIRLWCKNEDYWTVYDDVMDMVKTAFDRENISIPYPQMEVRIKE